MISNTIDIERFVEDTQEVPKISQTILDSDRGYTYYFGDYLFDKQGLKTFLEKDELSVFGILHQGIFAIIWNNLRDSYNNNILNIPDNEVVFRFYNVINEDDLIPEAEDFRSGSVTLTSTGSVGFAGAEGMELIEDVLLYARFDVNYDGDKYNITNFRYTLRNY
ncbi:hypothetical protein [Francisella sp. SYW-2]|uniref:hypothetical protein n=1 Tax=Francisella sp. SYW-2 TaxID=2610886 RepID=UPI00123E11EC|nr:hypothetical protein [Francisella sp. SYW-2]